jgi:hypothetical protein|tara:strand:- start:333 stop:911 length:579 start_codon:yes stop_codon:yes gene_type:complete
MNNSLIKQSLKKQAPKLLQAKARNILREAFQKVKNKMLAEFLAHPVTREIEGGIKSSNISGTLNNITNLYSFIGFNSGDDPIAPIEDLLLSTDIRFVKMSRMGLEFEVTLPDAKDIFAVTPLPWAPGRSWAKGIESGLSGLGYYLNKSTDKSRSGLGVQTSQKIRKGVKFTNTKYISSILNKYQKEFENITL